MARLGEVPTGARVRAGRPHLPPEMSFLSTDLFHLPPRDSLSDALIFSLHAMTDHTSWGVSFSFSTPSSRLETDFKWPLANQIGHFLLAFSSPVQHCFVFISMSYLQKKKKDP